MKNSLLILFRFCNNILLDDSTDADGSENEDKYDDDKYNNDSEEDILDFLDEDKDGFGFKLGLIILQDIQGWSRNPSCFYRT